MHKEAGLPSSPSRHDSCLMEVGYMRGVWSHISSDEGMTLVEIMVAAAILFVILTGVLGLAGQSINTGLQSKQTAVFNNVVNSYIERVQGMDFDKVIVGDELNGELAPQKVVTVEDFTVVIKPTVVAGATASLKSLTVDATITRGSGQPSSMSTTVTIRDKENYLTQGIAGPVVVWQPGMPAENEIVFGYQKASGGALYVSVKATASEGRTIRSVRITSDNGATLMDLLGNPAEWRTEEIGSVQTWTTPLFNWNTLQEAVIDAETGETGPIIADGARTIKVRVEDSAGAFTERRYPLIVDNYAPPNPSAADIMVAISPEQGPVVTWELPLDGTTPPASTRLGLIQQDVSGTWGARTAFDGVSGNQYPLSPFSRYIVDVQAIGVSSDSYSARTSEVTQIPDSLVAPPLVSGTYSYTGNRGSVSLAAPAPAFSVAAAPTYTWYQAASENGPWTTVFATGQTVTSKAYTGAIYLRCAVTLTPSVDYDGAPAEQITLWSNVLGATPTSKGSGSLESAWLP